ncbi:PA0069 family radical SAM protein [Aeromonas schubertii]|uniref:PA0069 family radical SAM protein n=1 Tax=Aeromonas schubertii TaxID=652 RepID=UPI0010A92BD2|nr:PA0069 family radical SAM protein [Aeromonas schubertii]MBZ6072084.1 PA0069 family radical SAM protein [Aeromonas schubertii]QCG48251.1 PA0069 family radical SAM protein [Aeromonas schubertii]
MAGRGASGNVVHRFTQQRIETVDDGWWQETASPSPATRISQVEARSIISHNRSPDVPFDASINPYQGCEHGCIYCYARPSHAYLELSPGLDFETRIFAKRNAPELLRAEFARPAYRPRVICIGANTDPYQPAEQRLRLTRELLKVMGDHGHPVTLITKSAMVLRDRDILAELAAEGLCRVMVSVTTLDETLRQRLEPRTTPGKGRLRVIEQLTRAGIPVGVLAAPMIPRLNEHELERILEGAAAAGADCAGYILLRLPRELAPLFETWLGEHYPGRREAVLSILRQSREGALNSPQFGERMRGQGEFANLLARRFRLAVRRLGLDVPRLPLRLDAFRRPGEQLTLF